MKKYTRKTLMSTPEACLVTTPATVEDQLHSVCGFSLSWAAPRKEGVPASFYGPPPLAAPLGGQYRKHLPCCKIKYDPVLSWHIHSLIRSPSWSSGSDARAASAQSLFPSERCYHLHWGCFDPWKPFDLAARAGTSWLSFTEFKRASEAPHPVP